MRSLRCQVTLRDVIAISEVPRGLKLQFIRAGLVSVAAAAGTGWTAWALAGLSAAAPLKAALLVATLLAIVAPRLAEHLHRGLGLANRLTLGRAVLVGWLAAFLWEPAAVVYGDALSAAALIALALDGLDGALARRSGTASEFGASLDMELDALTTLVLSGLCWQLGKAGPWILLAGSLRYLFGAASRAWPWMSAPLYPSQARRVVCGVQVGSMAVALSAQVPAWLSAPALAAALGLLLWSFGRDTLWLYRNR